MAKFRRNACGSKARGLVSRFVPMQARLDDGTPVTITGMSFHVYIIEFIPSANGIREFRRMVERKNVKGESLAFLDVVPIKGMLGGNDDIGTYDEFVRFIEREGGRGKENFPFVWEWRPKDASALALAHELENGGNRLVKCEKMEEYSISRMGAGQSPAPEVRKRPMSFREQYGVGTGGIPDDKLQTPEDSIRWALFHYETKREKASNILIGYASKLAHMVNRAEVDTSVLCRIMNDNKQVAAALVAAIG